MRDRVRLILGIAAAVIFVTAAVIQQWQVRTEAARIAEQSRIKTERYRQETMDIIRSAMTKR